MNSKTKYISTVAMLCALAYIVMALIKIPLVPGLDFLKYEPKDIIVAIGGFIFGPFTAFVISVIVSLIEMLTVSTTGVIGLVMNVLSTCSFACVAAIIYKKNKTIRGAFIGLLAGTLAMAAVMLLWNYFFTPVYMGVPRETVAKMLIPSFLPFNLLKGGINMALTMLIYKPIVRALRLANLIPESSGVKAEKTKKIGYMIFAAVIFITCIILVLVLKNII
ncbi:MAG: ECF transporter S component [Lachnospiraceae bacterium]|nr:ECF transporter S component [Lachnospiraceae bacterium]